MYEDILVETADLQTALKQLPERTIELRNRRIRRAFDLSMKHEYLPEAQRNYDPFESYLGDLVKRAEAKRIEKEIVGRA